MQSLNKVFDLETARWTAFQNHVPPDVIYVNAAGKMTGGFAYVAYPSKYDESGVQMTFIINQGVVFEKDPGKDTDILAKAMTDFNPDGTWTALK
jgi:hypothetical protein